MQWFDVFSQFEPIFAVEKIRQVVMNFNRRRDAVSTTSFDGIVCDFGRLGGYNRELSVSVTMCGKVDMHDFIGVRVNLKRISA